MMSVLHDGIRLILWFGRLLQSSANIKTGAHLSGGFHAVLLSVPLKADNYWGYTLGPNNIGLNYSLRKKCCLWATADVDSFI